MSPMTIPGNEEGGEEFREDDVSALLGQRTSRQNHEEGNEVVDEVRQRGLVVGNVKDVHAGVHREEAVELLCAFDRPGIELS